MFPVALSPCPNDTALFYPWLAGHIGKELSAKAQFADIATLNSLALNKAYPLLKVSFNAYRYLQKDYSLLPVGSALGHHCGPLLVAKKPFPLKELKNKTVAIPGKLTTAHLLLDLFAPKAKNKHFCLYHEIASLIEQGVVDCGIIIHESRFTYRSMGFHEIADFGALWHKSTGLPLPLGGLVLEKNSPHREKIISILQKGYTLKDSVPSEFILKHAQEMSWEVAKKHIALYVNQETYHLSETGQKAIDTLLEKAKGINHVS